MKSAKKTDFRGLAKDLAKQCLNAARSNNVLDHLDEGYWEDAWEHEYRKLYISAGPKGETIAQGTKTFFDAVRDLLKKESPARQKNKSGAKKSEKPSDDTLLMTFESVGGIGAPGDPVKTAVKNLGKYEVARKNSVDGRSVVYWRNYGVGAHVNRQNRVEYIFLFYDLKKFRAIYKIRGKDVAHSANWKTNKGIGANSTRADLLKAHGKPRKENTHEGRHSITYGRATFEFDGSGPLLFVRFDS